jgi:hypothetical protein
MEVEGLGLVLETLPTYIKFNGNKMVKNWPSKFIDDHMKDPLNQKSSC